jgi:hypothetical protein
LRLPPSGKAKLFQNEFGRASGRCSKCGAVVGGDYDAPLDAPKRPKA